MVRSIFLVAIFLSLSSLPAAAVADGPSKEGVVSGDRVNMRSGPSTNDPGIGFASRGDRLTVLSSKGGWYQVKCPRKLTVWLHSKYVSDAGVVTGSSVNLRPRPNTSHSPLGQVRKGDKVEVIGSPNKEGWVKIVPPASATAWIYGKYVQTTGAAPRRRARGPAVTPAGLQRPVPMRDRMLKLGEDYLRIEMEKEPEEMDMAPVIRIFTEVIDGDSPEANKERARTGLKEAQRWKRISDVMIEVNRPVPQIQDRAPYPSQRIRSDNEDDYLAVGWVEGRGKLLFADATHRLMRGEEAVYLLKSADFRLNDFVGKRIGIRGTMVGWEGSRKVVLVEDIHIFRR